MDDQEYIKELEDLLYWGWTIIANAWNGNWEDSDKGWKDAAKVFQKEYHELLPHMIKERSDWQEEAIDKTIGQQEFKVEIYKLCKKPLTEKEYRLR
jgi:hypothetical protein